METVLTQVGPVEGETRRPRVEVIAGTATETEVQEHGIRFRFDAKEVMFATGNRTERYRAGKLTHPGERVIDLFAGIGYFAIPAAKYGRAEEVIAVDTNPIAVHYLTINARINGVAERLRPILGDNRTAALPPRAADRVFLGYLPTSLPWIPRALSLLRVEGGWLHAHLVVDVHGGLSLGREKTAQSVEQAGAEVRSITAREVKPFGPGRMHVVVDVEARPGDPASDRRPTPSPGSDR